MLVSGTSAVAFPLTRFRSLARVPQKRARVPSLARVPKIAHLWPSHFVDAIIEANDYDITNSIVIQKALKLLEP